MREQIKNPGGLYIICTVLKTVAYLYIFTQYFTETCVYCFSFIFDKMNESFKENKCSLFRI